MCKVTIAIPIYNVEKYVEKSLLSALNQSFDDYEILIVDDKGTDSSMDVVRKIKETHPRGYIIRVIDHVVNRGTGAARNTAIDNAKGAFLYFMDSDDILELDTIKLLYDVIVNEKVDLVEGSYQRVSMEGVVLEKKIFPEMKVSGDFAICKWMQRNRIYYDGFACIKMYNLDFLKSNRIRCNDHHKIEDPFFSFQVVLYAKSIITISKITYNYVMRPDSSVNQDVDDSCYNQYLEIFRARTQLMRGLCSKSIPETLFNYYLQHFFEWWLRFVLLGRFSKQKKQYFYNTIQEMLTLNYSVKDLIGLRYKAMYLFMHLSDFRYIKTFYYIDVFAAKCYNRMNKYFHITKLPYSHL